MTKSLTTSRLTVSDLSQDRPTEFSHRPDAVALARIAAQLGLDGLRKFSLTGTIRAEGRSGWRLDARMGATVVQPCVVTLAPVTTRLDEDMTRLFLKELPEIDVELADDEETEMTSDGDQVEPLKSHIDLEALMSEALSLALPLYPRAGDAALDDAQFAAPGVTAMRDEDTRPFAGLAALRDKLEDGQ